MKMNNSRGFTLVEAIIVVAIIGILGTGAANLLKGIVRYFTFNQAQGAIQAEARTSLSLMNRFLRQGYYTSITVDSVASTDPPLSRIAFKTRELNGSIFWHRFYQSGNKLYHGTSTDGTTFSDSLLSTNLKTLTFGLPRTDDFTILSVSAAFEKGAGAGARALQMSVEKVRVMNAE